MRKFNLLSVLLFITLSIGFISCSKDDEPTIVGKWELVKHEYNSYVNGTSVDHVGEGQSTTLFNADGTGVSNKLPFTWTLEGTRLTSKSMNGDKEEVGVFDVQKLTNDELVIYTTYKEGDDNFYERLTFKKI